MPSVRVRVSEFVDEDLHPKKRQELMRWFREMTAQMDEGLTIEGVEVIWVVHQDQINAVDIGVEIIYSTTPDWNPEVNHLAERMVSWLRQTQLVGNRAKSVSVWFRPQPNAIFVIQER